MKQLLPLLQTLGRSQHKQDRSLLQTALTHKSYAMDYKNPLPHQERMEFLGDGILGAIIAHLLYEYHPDQDEAKLTIAKIALIREEMLARVARILHLGTYIRISKGEQRMGGADKDAILSDSLEALIAYCYLQWGWDTTYTLIKTHIWPEFLGRGDDGIQKSPKNRLQERAQAQYQSLPVYEDILTGTLAGNRNVYTSSVFIQGKLIATGTGPNKKRAQEDAAQQAIEIFTIS